jgi:ariadne-1
VGVEPKVGLKNPASQHCLICWNKTTEFDGLKCGHAFCTTCWKSYLQERLKLGKPALETTCPQVECPLTVPHSVWIRILSGNELLLTTYRKYHCQSFTDDNKAVKWCPRPGCIYAIECTNLAKRDVTCQCGTEFCFRCNRLSHRPCSCSDAQQWEDKNSSESENVTWMIANTK